MPWDGTFGITFPTRSWQGCLQAGQGNNFNPLNFYIVIARICQCPGKKNVWVSHGWIGAVVYSPHPPSSIFILHPFQPAVRFCEQMQADPRTPWVSRKRDSRQMDDRRSVEEVGRPFPCCYQKHSCLLQKVSWEPGEARLYIYRL